MEEPLALCDPPVAPTPEILAAALGKSYPAFEELLATLSRESLAALEWNYYRDGKAWMSKLMNGKKNLGWLQIYNSHFTIICFFTEKHLEAITTLDIAPEIKEAFYRVKPCGKLFPIRVFLRDPETFPDALPDALTMLRFKKGLK